jgi:hypothetical protein
MHHSFCKNLEPIFIMGVTVPMDESKRRPHSDWIPNTKANGYASEITHNQMRGIHASPERNDARSLGKIDNS